MKSGDLAYWNRFWEEPDVGPQWKHSAASELVRAEPFLDIGCGSGHLLELLRRKGLRSMVGCDIAASSTRILRAKALNAVRCDAGRPLPFGSKSFATAALVDVLEHTFHPAGLLAEAARVASEVVIVVPNFNSVVARLQVLAGAVPENNTPRKRHLYWFNRRALREIVSSVGLEIAEERFHPFKYDDPWLSAPFRALVRMRPPLFALAFAARLQRRS
jgi:SAM-dependent methyltransferase